MTHVSRALLIRSLIVLLSLVSSAATMGAEPPVIGREQVNATLWMQRAAEYQISALQVYRLATERLATTIAAPGSAALEQQGTDASRLAAMPTAIIVDLDETVLDNSFYQARRALLGGEYDEPSWQAWMREASAPAIAGSVEFLQAASRTGHKIFYVTNRECRTVDVRPDDACPARTATLRNLQALNLPNAADPDALSLRRERPEWESSDKTIRRQWIAETHRIVALVGDDLRDFVDRQVYAARADELAPLLGMRWFLLPNAMYGSWERAITGGACTSSMSAAECAEATTRKRYQSLQPEPSAGAASSR